MKWQSELKSSSSPWLMRGQVGVAPPFLPFNLLKFHLLSGEKTEEESGGFHIQRHQTLGLNHFDPFCPQIVLYSPIFVVFLVPPPFLFGRHMWKPLRRTWDGRIAETIHSIKSSGGLIVFRTYSACRSFVLLQNWTLTTIQEWKITDHLKEFMVDCFCLLLSVSERYTGSRIRMQRSPLHGFTDNGSARLLV